MRVLRRLTAMTRVEFRLLTREWAAMLFAFGLPPLMLVVLAGVFGNRPDEGFGGVVPSEYYAASYIVVPLGALALVGLPVMLASYRERDVLRRFEAFGAPTRLVVTAQALVTVVLVLLGAAVVLAVAIPTYGVPGLADPAAVVFGFSLGIATMVTLGVAFGLAAPTARAAQALGLLAFLPMWLLGGGGPPQGVMTDAMDTVADLLPLTHATAAVREPWLSGTATFGEHLLGLGIWLALGLAATALLLRRTATRQ